MAQTYAAKYLAKAALSAPRDLVNSLVATMRPIKPTVLIYNCTWVCDARCEMCANWKRGDRKSDMTLEQVDRVFQSSFWDKIEVANVSGGEPTTRNDLVEICELMIDRMPRLRKFGVNTTGLTPHRAIPMIEKIAAACQRKGVIFSTRVSIDGVGDRHNLIRNVNRGFDRANETIQAMREMQSRYSFNFGVSTTIFSMNLDHAEDILAWARHEKLDIVFNMIRFTEPMLGNATLENARRPMGEEEQRMRQFFLDRVRKDPVLDGQNYIYMHYADMIANGYHRLEPCPFQSQGIMLNPEGGLYFCENSESIGNAVETDPGELYFRKESQAHREEIRDKKCPTCLSPCQMNFGAVKQIFPYVRFITRAMKEKRRKASRS
jgi:sulfatase maturation enzyme AslB (radical SAM superfamily)